MASGINTLPRSFTIGSDVEAYSTFYAPLAFRLQESNDISGTTGGNFASLATADVVFVQSDGLHYRTYNPGSESFQSSILFGSHYYTYAIAVDFSNDGYQDLITANLTASTQAEPGATYITALKSDGATGLGILPFQNTPEVVSYIGPGSMQLDIEGAIIQASDLATADFNHDGFLDVIVVGVNNYSTNASDGNSVVTSICYAIGYGNGTGTFSFLNGWQPTGDNFGGQSSSFFSGRDALITPRVSTGDFDGDGQEDVAFAMHGDQGTSAGAFPPAYILWGDANAATTGLLNTASSNKYSNNWLQPQDIAGVLGQASDTVDQVVISFNSSLHVARFNPDRTLQQDNYITFPGIGRGNLGKLLDYDLDGLTDIVSVDGATSNVIVGYDWQGTTGNMFWFSGFDFGTEILAVAGFDYNGDGKPDLASGYNSDDHLYIYGNETAAKPIETQVTLVEGQRVSDGAINGVSPARMTGNGSQSLTVSLVGGNTRHDNALGYYIIDAEGRMGAARFLDLNAQAGEVLNIQLMHEGHTLGLFLLSGGQARNESLSGEFYFRERADLTEAGLGSRAPLLVREGDGRIVEGDIFHTLDADRIDLVNPLNAGGRVQALSRLDPSSSLVIGFEDTRLPFGDGDFNDLMLRVTHTDMVF